MAVTRTSRSSQVRARLDHPIIDADGHMLEFTPALPEYLQKAGGADFARHYEARMAASRAGDRSGGQRPPWAAQTWEQRRDTRTGRPPWWFLPTKSAIDAATTTVPRLLYERLEELGMDYVILYGNMGLATTLEPDAEMRRHTIRAINMLQADCYREFSSRMTPVAVIPMHTPEEALDELDFSVRKLGHKVVLIPPGVSRPIPALHREHPQAWPDACWVDHFSIDSQYDYDPVWARCVELGVAVTSHGGLFANYPIFGRSISNFVYNHLGNHAYLQGLLCKGILMGGVTHRFPTLNIAFLECGVGWACAMYAEVLGAWDRRNVQALEQTNPANLDRKAYLDLLARYGGKTMEGRMEAIQRSFDLMSAAVDMSALDEFAALGVSSRDDLRDRFVPRLYFGCEADDPINASAFNTKVNPYGARLNATFGSDIGHYDVPDMAKVVVEAHELVERGLLTDDDFRAFTCDNAIRLHGRMNPGFFKGTAVEACASRVLAKDHATKSARK
jgi:predicted TIM-barrel fold metal-dependent hydrolase